MSPAWYQADAFTPAHQEFCRTVVAEFQAIGARESAAAWADLGERIARVLGGASAPFTRTDLALVGALHRATLTAPRERRDAERGQILAVLSVLVYRATKGKLAQLQAGKK